MNPTTHPWRLWAPILLFLVLLGTLGCQSNPSEQARLAVSSLCAADLNQAVSGLTRDSQRVFRGLRTLSANEYQCDWKGPLELKEHGWSGPEEDAGVYLVTLSDGSSTIKAAMVREEGEWKLDLFSSAQLNVMWGGLPPLDFPPEEEVTP